MSLENFSKHPGLFQTRRIRSSRIFLDRRTLSTKLSQIPASLAKVSRGWSIVCLIDIPRRFDKRDVLFAFLSRVVRSLCFRMQISLSSAHRERSSRASISRQPKACGIYFIFLAAFTAAKTTVLKRQGTSVFHRTVGLSQSFDSAWVDECFGRLPERNVSASVSRVFVYLSRYSIPLSTRSSLQILVGGFYRALLQGQC